jgi:hypothetical protein
MNSDCYRYVVRFVHHRRLAVFQVIQDAKELLLWCATPDGVLRAKNKLRDFDFVEKVYYERQKHDNLLFYLDQKIRMEDSDGLYAQVNRPEFVLCPGKNPEFVLCPRKRSKFVLCPRNRPKFVFYPGVVGLPVN